MVSFWLPGMPMGSFGFGTGKPVKIIEQWLYMKEQ
jgi:hypothetical protein